MKRRSSLLSLCIALISACIFAFALALAGCNAPPPIAESPAQADTSAIPILEFDANWTFQQSGGLISGLPAILRYDFSRLPNCRATQDGVPAWSLYAGTNVDGGPETDVTLTMPTPPATATDTTFTVPYGRSLAIWFHNSDDHGCSEWDSRYGANYNMPIAGSAPAIHFKRDWSISVDGTPSAGQTLVIDYDIARLPTCRQDYNGLQSWDVLVDYQFDGGAVQQASLTQSQSNGYIRVASPARLSPPAGAHTITMWFENDDRTGCRAWDSDYGANFSFSL